MHNRILRHMREKIRLKQYIMTLHAEEEMSDDGFSIFDVERAILTGEIAERQVDHQSNELKYVIDGSSIYGDGLTVVAKIGPTDKLIIITVYRTN